MGSDKSTMLYQELPLYQHAMHKLEPFCDHIYLSTNVQQAMNHDYTCPIIIDYYEKEGPLSGILSSLLVLQKPIIVMACDMPYLDTKAIETLVSNRGTKATSFYNEEVQKYEAMLSIWEKEAIDEVRLFFEKGGRSAQQLFTSWPMDKIVSDESMGLRSVNQLADLQKNK
jgi:molybdenum cofactor guanylyltransferase